MSTAYRQHTTENLLHLVRFTAPLALVQELERRGYFYSKQLGRYTREWAPRTAWDAVV